MLHCQPSTWVPVTKGDGDTAIVYASRDVVNPWLENLLNTSMRAFCQTAGRSSHIRGNVWQCSVFHKGIRKEAARTMDTLSLKAAFRAAGGH